MGAWSGDGSGEVNGGPSTRLGRRVEGKETYGGEKMMAGSSNSGLLDDVELVLRMLTFP